MSIRDASFLVSPEVVFAKEPLTDALWDEALPLLFDHWKEVAHYHDIKLNPDRDSYNVNQQVGLLRCFTARQEGRLVGYSLFFVRPHLHYADTIFAYQDVIYVDPKARGSTGYRFICYCDAQLKAEGVNVVTQHIKAAHNFGKMLERQGYELMDLIYTKRLD